ncbi:acetyltransferase-like isoleucine patch superfamily enzyme [Flavobacterium sp. 7E]|uniref:acyltransferase n=1 Tax=Flavobacterium sp. 7E TaxID=2735898 RepID=UPI00156FDBC5|nr:acyltransferase [Flavobacterium sp. 7E]NRS90163.1 acetyltransferase-like isoleucine patch superfamily enzyme [Flavobacterium sp. 7E]
MFLKDIYRKIKFDLSSDRIGPDIPFTHWKLFFSKKMLKLCKSKFLKFEDTAHFRPGAYAVGCSQIKIGKRVVIRPGCRLFGESPELDLTITIEDDVMLGSGVQIYINNHRFDMLGVPIIDQGVYPPKAVTLKRGCWIGANAIILPGVIIGENSVIGAGSIVTKSIPAGVVAAGNPAKIIKTI